MGKLYKFNFPLSGRKNVAKSEDFPTRPAPQVSKAQRVLGTEAIDLNICISTQNVTHKERNATHQEWTQCPHIAVSSNRKMDVSSIRKDAIENIHSTWGKASSVLGIGQDCLDTRKSSAPSIHSLRSFGTLSSSSSWTPRSEDSSHIAGLQSYGTSQSSISNHELGFEDSQAPRYNQMAHIATYIDKTMDSLSELPSDNPINVYSRSKASRQRSPSNSYNNSRPGSSASCPIETLPQTVFSTAELRGTFGNLNPSYKSDNRSNRPEVRYKNKSLPYPPTTTEYSWPSQSNYSTKEVMGDIDLEDSSEDEKEGSDTVPMFLRSSVHLTLASQTDSQPTTPQGETSFLTIPDFMDLNISGPWCESGDNSQLGRSSFCQKDSPTKYDNTNHPAIHTISPTLPIDENYLEMIEKVSSRPQSPIKLLSHFHYSSVNEDKTKVQQKLQSPTESYMDEKYTVDFQSDSLNLHLTPISNAVDANSRVSCSKTTNSKEDTKNKLNQRLPLFVDTTGNGWNQPSPISTLCIDFDSASSATLLKNERFYSDHELPPELSVVSNRCSSIYPSNALMEVARVGKVIRRAPANELAAGRKKERPALIDVKKLPVSPKVYELA